MRHFVRQGTPHQDVERRIQQIKEIVRIGATLRADVDLGQTLTQIVQAISTTLGFRVAVLNLLVPGAERFDVVATIGLTESERQRLVASPPPVRRIMDVMRPEFCVSNSYLIPNEYSYLLDGVEGVTVYTALPATAQRTPDMWHPDDALFVPLSSPRGGDLLGVLSLDQPEDGKRPTEETIEIVELFASQAAIAIETSRLFSEREAERRSLDRQLLQVLGVLEQVRQHQLDVRAQLAEQALAPIGQGLNEVLDALSGVVLEARTASEVVSANAADMRDAAIQLAAGAQEQAERINEVARSIEATARSIRTIADVAGKTSAAAREALEVSEIGREAAERAAEGMSAAREMALQSLKKMKRLSESGQEIGEIVQLVSDIATKTNLLALNAAIEAARAGEHGQGFAIVAKEIRNLAVTTAEATKQINARIQAIQTETNGVVVTIEHSAEQIVAQSDAAQQAGAALHHVDLVVQAMAQAVEGMSATATQQADAAAMLSYSVSGIAQDTTQARDRMQAMRDQMDRLVELSQSLLRSIGVFRLGQAGQVRAAPVTGVLGAGAGTGTGALAGGPEQATQPMPAVGGPTGHLQRLGPPTFDATPSVPQLPERGMSGPLRTFFTTGGLGAEPEGPGPRGPVPSIPRPAMQPYPPRGEPGVE